MNLQPIDLTQWIPFGNVKAFLGLNKQMTQYYIKLYPPVKTTQNPFDKNHKLYNRIDVEVLKTWLQEKNRI